MPSTPVENGLDVWKGIGITHLVSVPGFGRWIHQSALESMLRAVGRKMRPVKKGGVVLRPCAVSSRFGWVDGLGDEAQDCWRVSQRNCLNREYFNWRSVWQEREAEVSWRTWTKAFGAAMTCIRDETLSCKNSCCSSLCASTCFKLAMTRDEPWVSFAVQTHFEKLLQTTCLPKLRK